MLKENCIFRIHNNNKWTMLMPRSKLIVKLRELGICRSWNWPYTIKKNTTRKLKTKSGQVVVVRRELDYYDAID